MIYIKNSQPIEEIGIYRILINESYFIYLFKKLIITLYVDNIQYFGELLEDIINFKKSLEESFKITYPSKLTLYLEINVYYN